MNLIEFSHRIKKASTIQQVEKIFCEYLSKQGFRYFAFTYYSGHVKTGRKLRYHYVSDALRPWHLHYLEQGYADNDRTLEENFIQILPLFWDVKEQLKHAKNKREQRIRLESIEFGIDKGLSIPIHGPNHDFVNLTLHQFKHEHCLQKYEHLQFEWIGATYIFYNFLFKIFNLKKTAVKPYQLTKREEQCLALTAKSWRVEQIAKELKISERTVNFHIQNANKKLGTNNKHQASYKYFHLS